MIPFDFYTPFRLSTASLGSDRCKHSRITISIAYARLSLPSRQWHFSRLEFQLRRGITDERFEEEEEWSVIEIKRTPSSLFPNSLPSARRRDSSALKPAQAISPRARGYGERWVFGSLLVYETKEVSFRSRRLVVDERWRRN